MPLRSQTEPTWSPDELQELSDAVSVLGKQWTEISVYFDNISPKAIEAKVRACVRHRDSTVLAGIRTFNRHCLNAGLSKHLVFPTVPACFFQDDRIHFSMLFPSSTERSPGDPDDAEAADGEGGAAGDNDSDSSDGDDPMCCICRAEDMDSTLIVCDREPQCTAEFHLSCLAPPLAQVPVDTWLCPRCSITCFLRSAGLELRNDKTRRNGGKRSPGASGSAEDVGDLLGSLQEPQKVRRVRDVSRDAPWLAMEEECKTSHVPDPFDQDWPVAALEPALEPPPKRARRK